MYCTTDDVYNATTLGTGNVGTGAVTQFIQGAEAEVDRLSFTTYWNVEDNGTSSTTGTSTSLVDTTKSWTANEYEGMTVWLYEGTGSDQARKIVSNTATGLVTDRAWTTIPNATSKYRIVYTASSPEQPQTLIDGNDKEFMYLEYYPLRILESLSVDSTSITTSTVYKYYDEGKIQLGSTSGMQSEKTIFNGSKPQLVNIRYWYGVYPIPWEVKRYTIVSAALKTLSAQMGGTHNIPSTYSLPEGSVTIGQAYINIRGTFDVLKKEQEELKKVIIKYPSVYAGY